LVVIKPSGGNWYLTVRPLLISLKRRSNYGAEYLNELVTIY